MGFKRPVPGLFHIMDIQRNITGGDNRSMPCIAQHGQQFAENQKVSEQGAVRSSEHYRALQNFRFQFIAIDCNQLILPNVFPGFSFQLDCKQTTINECFQSADKCCSTDTSTATCQNR